MDETWLRVREVAERLTALGQGVVSQARVRQYADAGYLRSSRPPVTRLPTGFPHRRFPESSVAELERVLQLPESERAEAMEELRQRNTTEPLAE